MSETKEERPIGKFLILKEEYKLKIDKAGYTSLKRTPLERQIEHLEYCLANNLRMCEAFPKIYPNTQNIVNENPGAVF